MQNCPTRTVRPIFYEFYEQTELTDLTILVEGEPIQVHGIVLACQSPVFKAMLTTPTEGSFSKVVISYPKIVFRKFLQFLYLGECDEGEHTAMLLKIANEYQVEGLIKKCALSMMENITVETASDTFLTADLCGLPTLKDAAKSFIRGNFGQVSRTEDWQRVASKWKLVNELIESFPPMMRTPGIDLEMKTAATERPTMIVETAHIWRSLGDSEDRSHFEWRLRWESIKGYSIVESPIFNVIVGGQLLEFEFVFRRPPRKKFSMFQIVLMSERFQPPVRMLGEFKLEANQKKDEIKETRELNWPIADWANNKRTRTALTISPTTREFYVIEDYMRFHFSYSLTTNDQILQPAITSSNANCLGALWIDRKYVDVHFKLGKEPPIGAHRVVLASKSSFFNNLFQDGRKTYVLQEDPEDFFTALNYMYTGRLPSHPTLSQATLARKYGLRDLFGFCARPKFSPQMAVKHLIDSHLTGLTEAKKAALRSIRYNIGAAVNSADWPKLEGYPELLNDILKQLTYHP